MTIEVTGVCTTDTQGPGEGSPRVCMCTRGATCSGHRLVFIMLFMKQESWKRPRRPLMGPGKQWGLKHLRT